MLPNVWVHKIAGKLSFLLCDVLTGFLLDVLVKASRHKTKREKPSGVWLKRKSFLWLLNPLVVNVSTRGNAESVVSLLVVACLYFFDKQRLILSGILLGTSIHFKIYPILYSLPLTLYLLCSSFQRKEVKKNEGFLKQLIVQTWNTKTITFVLSTAFTFTTLTTWMYLLYGMPFLHNTYFYHLTRKDHRHNFSLFFYHFYLSQSKQVFWSHFQAIFSFLPQLAIIVFLIFKYVYEQRNEQQLEKRKRELYKCLLLQTIYFVTFNKVCTVQYFIWFFTLLPLAVSSYSSLPFLLWFLSQVVWLLTAYLLEFQSQNTFLPLFFSSLLFFFSNLFLSTCFM